MENDKKYFLLQVSLLIALIFAICFYRNSEGVACVIFGIFITGVLFGVIVKKKKRTPGGFDFAYGTMTVLLSVIPAYTDKRFLIVVGKMLFLMVFVKWSVHIAYDLQKIEFAKNIEVYFQFFGEMLSQIFSPFIDFKKQGKNQYGQQRGYVPPFPNGPGMMNNGSGGAVPPNGVSYPNGNRNVPPYPYGNWYGAGPGMNAGNPSQSFMPEGEQNHAGKHKSPVLSYVFTGVLVALPMLIIVLVLLTSADIMFKRLIYHLLLGIDTIGDAIVWGFVFLFAFMGAYAAGRTLILKRIRISERNYAKTNVVTGITFSGIFAGVYVLFCMVQLVGLLNTSGNLLPEGYTYARYARTGFFQLLVVCLINVFMVIICRIKFEDHKVMKGLLTLISLCTCLMVASSTYRICLYIGRYQLTFWRIMALWVLSVIAIWMVFVIWFIYHDRMALFEYGLCVVVMTFLVVTALRPDRLVMTYNLDRFDEQTSDMGYIFNELSMDGADILIHSKLAEDENYDFRIKQRCQEIISRYDRKYKGDFRKYNWSRYRAYQEAKAYLDME